MSRSLRLPLSRTVVSSLPETPLFGLGGNGPPASLLQDNLAWRADGTPAPLTGRYRDSAEAQLLPVPPGELPLPPRLPVPPAAELEAALPALVGARPWDRDVIDRRLLAQLTERHGRLIDDELEVGGLPAVREPTRRVFDAAAWHLSTMTPRAGWRAP